MAADDSNGSPDAGTGIGLEKGIRGVQAVVGLCIVSGLFWGWMCFRQQEGKAGAGLAGTVNPNTASMGSLMRLEGIGPVRALQMLRYRQQTDGRSFERPEDLENVSGIGPKTVSKMAPFLAFEQEQMTTEETNEGQNVGMGD
ncbi:MAG TPA: helix-hairpin-helix domain-containing protein [Anaerohalosphaeraceae bacterium]|nr:helix-hairpin-helix domain-containing protein [Anaerohalosphaeraceae bacterium]